MGFANSALKQLFAIAGIGYPKPGLWAWTREGGKVRLC